MALMAMQEPLSGAVNAGRLSHIDLSDIPRGEAYAGMRLRRFREEANYSIRALGEECSPRIPESTLRFLEAVKGRLKRRNPEHVGYVKEIAKVLGVAELRIWEGDGISGGVAETGRNESDLIQDVASFLARLSVNRGLDTGIRDEAKILLDQIQELG